MSTVPVSVAPASMPPPTGGAPPGAPPGTPLFHRALEDELARTAAAEGQSRRSSEEGSERAGHARHESSEKDVQSSDAAGAQVAGQAAAAGELRPPAAQAGDSAPPPQPGQPDLSSAAAGSTTDQPAAPPDTLDEGGEAANGAPGRAGDTSSQAPSGAAPPTAPGKSPAALRAALSDATPADAAPLPPARDAAATAGLAVAGTQETGGAGQAPPTAGAGLGANMATTGDAVQLGTSQPLAGARPVAPSDLAGAASPEPASATATSMPPGAGARQATPEESPAARAEASGSVRMARQDAGRPSFYNASPATSLTGPAADPVLDPATGGPARTPADPAQLAADPRQVASAAEASSGTAQHAAPGAAQPSPGMPLAAAPTTAAPPSAAPGGTPMAAANAGLQDMIDSIHATIDLAARQGVSRARIALQPAELGAIRVHLSQSSDGLIARLTADTPAAAAALLSARAELHHSLSALGTTLLRLDIGSPGQPGERQRQAGDAPATATGRSDTTGGEESIDAEDPGANPTVAPAGATLGELVDVLA